SPFLGSTISIQSLNGQVEIAVPITGDVSGGGSNTIGLQRTGGGGLTISAPSTYTRNTTIQSGTPRLAGGDNRLPTNTVVSITSTNGTPFIPGILDLNGTNQTLVGIQDGTTGGIVVLTGTEVKLGGGTLTINNPTATVNTYGGAIT